MPTVTLHYDGWLRLPAEVCQRLRLATRSTLRVRVEGGTVVLEPSAIAEAPPPDDAEARQGTPASSAVSTAAPDEPALAVRKRAAGVGRQTDEPLLQGPAPKTAAEPKADEGERAPPAQRRAVRKPPAALVVGSAVKPRGRRKASASAGDGPSL